MAEHPRSVLKHLIEWPHQVTQPHHFGVGDTGLAEQKETWLFWRGWSDISPTDMLAPPYVSRIKAVRASCASDRDALKSRSHPGMMRAVARHATVQNIIPSAQPDVQEELRALAERYAAAHGWHNVPSDWSDPMARAPPWAARSIAYLPSPGARAQLEGGRRFARRPGAVGAARSSLRATPDDSTLSERRQVPRTPGLCTLAQPALSPPVSGWKGAPCA